VDDDILAIDDKVAYVGAAGPPPAGNAWFENTAVCLSPAEAPPSGRLVVNAGQLGGNDGVLYSRPIIAQPDHMGLMINAHATATPCSSLLGASEVVGTDNQIVRLPGGVVIAERDGAIWSPFVAGHEPEWVLANEQPKSVFGNVPQPNNRGAMFFFRSTDGGKTWSRLSTVDFGLDTVAAGIYGFPRPVSFDASGNATVDVPLSAQTTYPNSIVPAWWVGGPDRTEMYHCPFTQTLYATTRMHAGVTGATSGHDEYRLLFSHDGGLTWRFSSTTFPGWEPLMLTSTPNGRLFLFQLGSAPQPTIWWSLSLGVDPSKGDLTFSPGYGVSSPIHPAPPIVGADPSVIGTGVGNPGLSRLSADAATSKVRVSYLILNDQGCSEAVVLELDATAPDSAPKVSELALIGSLDPGRLCVAFPSFIDPDPTLAPEAAASPTLMYWMEAPLTGAGPPPAADPEAAEISVRCMLLGPDPTAGNGPTLPLSVSQGKVAAWSTATRIGHYVRGGYFWDEVTLTDNYLAIWTNATEVRTNIVSYPHARTFARPGLAAFDDGLIMAWRGEADDSSIWWNTFDGRNWAPQAQISGVGTSDGPVLANYGGLVYAAWKGEGSDQRIWWSRFDGKSWAPQAQIPAVGTSTTPALAAFAGKLHAVWKGGGTDTGIWWCWFDGTSWRPQQLIPNVGTGTSPALAVFKDALYAAWKGEAGDSGIWYASFNGARWSGQRQVQGVGTSGAPSLAATGLKLFLAWKGEGSDEGIWWCSNDALVWSPQQQIPNVASSDGPALHVSGGTDAATYAVWKGAGQDQHLWYITIDGPGPKTQESVPGVGTGF
jgi:hypothetical protein